MPTARSHHRTCSTCGARLEEACTLSKVLRQASTIMLRASTCAALSMAVRCRLARACRGVPSCRRHVHMPCLCLGEDPGVFLDGPRIGADLDSYELRESWLRSHADARGPVKPHRRALPNRAATWSCSSCLHLLRCSCALHCQAATGIPQVLPPGHTALQSSPANPTDAP